MSCLAEIDLKEVLCYRPFFLKLIGSGLIVDVTYDSLRFTSWCTSTCTTYVEVDVVRVRRSHGHIV